MKISDLISFSFNSLLKRKFRTFLTVLGVVIGTISIVVMISLGFGMKASIMESMNSFGDMKVVEVGLNNYGSDNDSEQKFIDDNLAKELSNLEHVEYVMPTLEFNAMLKCGKYVTYATINGVSKEGFDRLGLEFSKGGLPNSDAELQFALGNMIIPNFYDPKTYVCPYFDKGELIDYDPFEDPLYVYLDMDAYYGRGSSDSGETKAPKKYKVAVSGILKGELNEWNAYSNSVFCDINVLENYLKKEFKNRSIPGQPTKKSGKPYREIFYSKLNVYVDDMENVFDVQQALSEMGYQAFAQAEWIQSEMSIMNIIQIVLGGIGAVSLFVAAIGITNTMSMSIYERTREIGVMKVIGCRIKDIQAMFLIEAGFIGFIGGVIGVIISYLASFLMNKFLVNVMSEMGLSTLSIIPLWLSVASIVFAIIIGMVAGFFPSLRAMKLSPLSAIKNE